MNTTDRESLVERFFNGQVRVICCTDIGSGKRSYPSKKSDLTEASLDDEEIDRLALAKLKPEDSFENWSQLREL